MSTLFIKFFRPAKLLQICRADPDDCGIWGRVAGRVTGRIAGKNYKNIFKKVLTNVRRYGIIIIDKRKGNTKNKNYKNIFKKVLTIYLVSDIITI